MKVFKFGGASIKSASAIKNVAKILNSQDLSNCLLVISAMGKMTNAFEKITDAYFNNDQEKLTESIDFTSNFHLKIINNLFTENHVICQKINVLFGQLGRFLTQNKSRTKMIMQVHDELVFEIFENDINSPSEPLLI